MSVGTGSAAQPGAGRRRTGLLAAVLLTGATVSAGCGYMDEADGAETIPRVERPRDITTVADQPCELLTPQQAARFGLDRPPRQIQGRLGNVECEWRSSRADVCNPQGRFDRRACRLRGLRCLHGRYNSSN